MLSEFVHCLLVLGQLSHSRCHGSDGLLLALVLRHCTVLNYVCHSVLYYLYDLSDVVVSQLGPQVVRLIQQCLPGSLTLFSGSGLVLYQPFFDLQRSEE